MLVNTQWPLKRALHLTLLAWVCVVWRSESSLGLSALCENIDTRDKELLISRCRRSTPVKLCLIYFYIDGTEVFVDGIHNFALKTTALCVAIRERANTCHFLTWMRAVRQTMTRWYRGVFRLTWWRHQVEAFSCYWPFVRGINRSPVNSPHKGQWRGALMFSLIFAWINGRVNNHEAGDLGRHRAYYDVIIMYAFYRWTKQSIHTTLVVVNRYLQPMGGGRFQTRRGLVSNRFIPH